MKIVLEDNFLHKSSFQSMEKFKNDYLNPEKPLNILEIGRASCRERV